MGTQVLDNPTHEDGAYEERPFEGQPYEDYLRQLQSIHQMRDQLELDGRGYRELLERLTGTRSAKFLSAAQREAVISYMKTYLELDAAVTHAEEARQRLAGSFRTGVEPEAFEKEVYLAGEWLHTSRASLEAIVTALREQHGAGLRLVGARELQDGRGTRLRLEFDRLPF